MNYPTAPLYETIKGARPVPLSRPTSFQGYYVSQGHSSKAVQEPLGPIATKYECPICYNYLLPPIYQCYGGHAVCNDCEAKVKKCPTCQGVMPKNKKKIRSLVLEEIVEGSRFSCRNHLLGCPVENLRYDQIKDHTSTCPFTEIPYCEQLGINCKEKCLAGNLIDHLKSKHGVVGSTFNCCCLPGMEIMESVPDLKVKDSLRHTPYYLVWDSSIFFVKTKYEKNCCSWMVCSVGSTATRSENTDANDFVADIKLSSGSGSEDSQLNSLSWRGQVGTLTTPFGFNKFTFSVPLQTLKMYSTVSKDKGGISKHSWSIGVRLQKRNQTATPLPAPDPAPLPFLPRQTTLQAQTSTESFATNMTTINEDESSINFSSTALGNEITSEPMKSSPPPLPRRSPAPSRLAKFRSSLPVACYPVLTDENISKE